MKVALLTGGKDPHYARGLARELAVRGVDVALVGSRDEMSAAPEAAGRIKLHDFVGDLDPQAGPLAKVGRVVRYYAALAHFARRTDARLFHILWFRRFAAVERVLLTAYLRILGKAVRFTAHNVDDRARAGAGSGWLERCSLRFLYRRVAHVFVHTAEMKRELTEAFDVPEGRVTVVPLGINDVIPTSDVDRATARRTLGLPVDGRILLFFGNIAPYKGVEDLVQALHELRRHDTRFIAVIAGRVKDAGSERYWSEVERLIFSLGMSAAVRRVLRYIPDDEVALFFKAADVSVLPYRRVYQSGVLGLSYAQGRPVIAADVGAMKDDIIEGQTGLLFRPAEPGDLAAKVEDYFSSDLCRDLETRESGLRQHGAERFSWAYNADRTHAVYQALAR
jgi:glycosyltransferase involved in cell wall biosynthesis